MWPDEPLERWFTAHRTPALVDVAEVVALLGDTRVVAALSVALGFLLARHTRSWAPPAFAVGGWLGIELAARALKAVIDRPRPPFADAVHALANSSMPSANVARAAYAVVLLSLFVPRRLLRRFAAAGAVLVAGVAWSRLELGTHWFSDTVVAWPLGLAFGWPATRFAAWRAAP